METIISMFSLGLMLLIIAWLIQLVQTKNKKEINRNFMVVYGFGIIAIVLDGLMQGLILAPILNLLVLIVILAVMFKTVKSEKTILNKKRK